METKLNAIKSLVHMNKNTFFYKLIKRHKNDVYKEYYRKRREFVNKTMDFDTKREYNLFRYAHYIHLNRKDYNSVTDLKDTNTPAKWEEYFKHWYLSAGNESKNQELLDCVEIKLHDNKATGRIIDGVLGGVILSIAAQGFLEISDEMYYLGIHGIPTWCVLCIFILILFFLGIAVMKISHYTVSKVFGNTYKQFFYERIKEVLSKPERVQNAPCFVKSSEEAMESSLDNQRVESDDKSIEGLYDKTDSDGSKGDEMSMLYDSVKEEYKHSIKRGEKLDNKTYILLTVCAFLFVMLSEIINHISKIEYPYDSCGLIAVIVFAIVLVATIVCFVVLLILLLCLVNSVQLLRFDSMQILTHDFYMLPAKVSYRTICTRYLQCIEHNNRIMEDRYKRFSVCIRLMIGLVLELIILAVLCQFV